MSDHTPAPWIITDDDDYYIESEFGDTLGPALQVKFDSAKWEDVCLVSAAPELLTALQFAKSVIRSGEPWTDECERIIDGALKKAKGYDI